MSSKWNKHGDACPECGGTNTVVKDTKRLIDKLHTLGGGVGLSGRDSWFVMHCKDCKHKETKLGQPG
jgi:hypothetical protein